MCNNQTKFIQKGFLKVIWFVAILTSSGSAFAFKLITAEVSHTKLNAIVEALSDIGISRYAVTEIKITDTQKNYIPKVKLDVTVSDAVVDRAVETIVKADDGGKNDRIYIQNLEQVIRIGSP